jgi:hypothetical protein
MVTAKAVKKAAPKPVAPKKAVTTRARPAVKAAAKAAPKAKASALNGAAAKASGKKAKPAAKIKSADPQKEKIKKAKLVRDSFTMPETEYQGLGEIKKACLKAGFEVKKSELLRIGVALIRKMDPVALKEVLASLPPLKAGRPKKDK